MKRAWIILACLLCAGFFAGSPGLDAAAEEEAEGYKGKLIGVGKCNKCHKSAKRGNQKAVWEASAHAQAYATLATDEAKAIAAEKGIEDPQKAPECLSCHTTDGFLAKGVEVDPAGTYSPEEGIGCEACHGPGSSYKKMSTMKDPEKSAAAGLIMPPQDHCLQCHNENSPTYKEFDYEARWAEIVHPVPAKE